MKYPDFLKLAASLLLPQLAGIVGSIFTVRSIPTWYASLQRPDFAPPNWIFAPVWTTLFIMMGISAFLIWRRGTDKKEVKVALAIFIIQLVLNTLWSVIFFGFQNPGAALIEISLLWLAILATIILFSKISRVASLLLWPYLLWVTFASYLNYAIWRLN